MPSSPTLGEGFVRTYDLLSALDADVNRAYEVLEAKRESQYLRRCLVRALFSYIEAAVECVKVEVRSTIRAGGYTPTLTQKESKALGPLALITSETGEFLPLEQNVKRTFKLAAKVWGLNFSLSTSGQEFKSFMAAKKARNKLTHPRTFYDIQVTDHDMHHYATAGMWFKDEFSRLFKTRIDLLLKDLPADERVLLLKSPGD